MKETHSINQVEELMYDLQNRLVKALTKEEKKAILKQLRPLQRHWNDIQEKHINGKHYPEKKKPVELSKKDLLALIDSVKTNNFFGSTQRAVATGKALNELDLSGGSPIPGENRFKFVEKGW